MEWFGAASNNKTYAYIFLDALTTHERAYAFQQLKAHNIPYEQHETSLGSNADGKKRAVARIELTHVDALQKAGFERAWHSLVPDALENENIAPSPSSAEALLGAHKAQWLPTSKGYNLFFAGSDYYAQHQLQSLLGERGIGTIAEDVDSPYGMGVRVLSHATKEAVENFGHLLPPQPQLDYRLDLSGLIAHKDNYGDIKPNNDASWEISGKPAELEFLRIGLAEKGISAQHHGTKLEIHPAYKREFQDFVRECSAAITRPFSREDLAPPKPSLSPALQQAQRFNQNHRIDTDEAIFYGYKDGGRRVKFDEQGMAVTTPNREIIVVRPPEQDYYLAQAFAEAHKRVAHLPDARTKITALHNLVAELLPENSPAHNSERMEKIIGGDYVGKEISLGQLIQAETGVCRHRSLLFKVLADHVGIKTALVRGNFLSSRGSGGHAWNEAELENGERLLVDVMHNKIATAQDNYVQFYADVRDNYLYRSEEKAQNPLIAQKGIRRSEPQPRPAVVVPAAKVPPVPQAASAPVADAAGKRHKSPAPSPEAPREGRSPAPVPPPAAEEQRNEQHPDNARDYKEPPAPPPPEAVREKEVLPPAEGQDKEPPHANRNKVIFGSVAAVIVAAIALILGKQLLGDKHAPAQQPAGGRGR